MDSPRSSERVSHAVPTLAVFDLDGTLTLGDTLLPYVLVFLFRWPRRALRLPALALRLAGAGFRRKGRDHLKELLIGGVFAGTSREDIAALTAGFVARLLRDGLRPRARERLQNHLAAGHRVLILSASTDLYVPDIARALGCHACHCTQMEWRDDKVGERFRAPNMRGQRKTEMLRAIRREWSGNVVAYGNSNSDLDHLRLADEGVLVTTRRRLQRRAAELGLSIEQW